MGEVNLPQKDHISHLFVSIIDLKTKSKYGWVKGTNEFALQDFVETHYGNSELTLEEEEHIFLMLYAISVMDINTPVAATYSQKGFMDKKMNLKVHKVIFHGV